MDLQTFEHEYQKILNVFLLYFQIRIDKLVDKWSGSIEIGVTTHNPNNLDYPATMTNLRSGNTHTQHTHTNCIKENKSHSVRVTLFCFYQVQS